MKNENLGMKEALFSLILFVGIWLWLWLGVPEYLLYQEQYQLFLWYGDYFAGRMEVPGGFADWLGEFVVQFYYVPLYGALLSALVLALSQILLGSAFRNCSARFAAYVLGAFPPLFYIALAGDENTLFSFAAAMLLSSAFIFIDSFRNCKSKLADSLVFTVGFALLYWLAGPIAFIYVLVCGLRRRAWFATAVALPACVAVVCLSHALILGQYPFGRLVRGLNYYRIPEWWPAFLYLTALSFIFPAAASLMRVRRVTVWSLSALAAVGLFAFLFVPSGYNPDKSRVFQYDSLVRQGRWKEIIEKARKEPSADIFCIQALNLALGMTGQLTDRMFEFPQKGPEGLIGEDRLDNTSPLVTAEALYRLGLTNIAFSTTFDLQESIMNDRKSGRFMKRLAECSIINGNYAVAEKYIGYLKKSLFYAAWAKDAEKLCGDAGAADCHPVYGPLRRAGFGRVAFYDCTQIDRILAIAASESKGGNPLAWQYFCGAAMLKGDLQTLTGIYSSTRDMYDKTRIPRHVQEAIAMFWTSGHTTFEGLPFQIDEDVKRRTMALAQTVQANPRTPAVWQNAAPGSFSIYFLNLMSQPPTQQQSTQFATHE